jgi:hemerythrin-like domain-containing protein
MVRLVSAISVEKGNRTMARTQAFRDQHVEILTLVKAIEAELVLDKLKKNSNDVLKMFAGLSGKLKIHLAMEDKGLYPMLAHHADQNVRVMGESYMNEMANITEAYLKFSQERLTPVAIEKDPSGFIFSARKVFSLLSKRIDKENKELYTLLESA